MKIIIVIIMLMSSIAYADGRLFIGEENGEPILGMQISYETHGNRFKVEGYLTGLDQPEPSHVVQIMEVETHMFGVRRTIKHEYEKFDNPDIEYKFYMFGNL